MALAPAAIIAIALTAYFLFLRYGDVEAELQNRGQSLVRQLAPAAEYGAFSGNRSELLRLAQAVVQEPDVVAVSIHDTAGKLLASAGQPSQTAQEDDASALAEESRVTPHKGAIEVFRARIQRPELPFDDPFQDGTLAPTPKDSYLGAITLELSRANLENRKREILGVTVFTTLLVLALALLLAHRLGRDITEPVLALEDAVARIRAGKQGVRIPPHPSGTLVSLENGFNEMAVTLDASHHRSASALAHSEAELARQLEIAQTKKIEAERASETKSRFLAAASHDLRQPLHALTLFAAELAAAVTQSRNRRLASQIVTAAGAMGELLDALLDVSRLDIAAIEPRRCPVSLGPLLEMIADAHRQSATIKGLRLNCRPTPLWVDSDPQLLRRMIGNLLANAVRYTQRGGILLAARPRGDRVHIEVWDTGIGIDPAHRPYLFQEFYQVGNPERDAGKGLGLGLAIVERLGQMLGHPVTVHSKQGRGSVFSVSLPRCMPAPRPSMEPPSGVPFRPRVAVRTVEMDQCGEICDLLDAWGYERACACSDEELPELLGSKPAVVICDGILLNNVARHLVGLDAMPRLIVLGEATDPLPPGISIEARLASPTRPARLRALLHHLLLTEETDSGESTEAKA